MLLENWEQTVGRRVEQVRHLDDPAISVVHFSDSCALILYSEGGYDSPPTEPKRLPLLKGQLRQLIRDWLVQERSTHRSIATYAKTGLEFLVDNSKTASAIVAQELEFLQHQEEAAQKKAHEDKVTQLKGLALELGYELRSL